MIYLHMLLPVLYMYAIHCLVIYHVYVYTLFILIDHLVQWNFEINLLTIFFLYYSLFRPFSYEKIKMDTNSRLFLDNLIE